MLKDALRKLAFLLVQFGIRLIGTERSRWGLDGFCMQTLTWKCLILLLRQQRFRLQWASFMVQSLLLCYSGSEGSRGHPARRASRFVRGGPRKGCDVSACLVEGLAVLNHKSCGVS